MQCPICDKVASESARFCEQCGHDLQAQQLISEADILATDDVQIDVVGPVSEEQPPVSVGNETFADADMAHNTLPPDSPEPAMSPATTGELPMAGPHLILQDDGKRYPLFVGQEIIIGREDPLDGIYPDIDLTPHDADTGVSRQHASLHEQGGQWFIKDLASTNYTIVNRRRLTAHEDFLLEDGDELRFGRVVAAFKI